MDTCNYFVRFDADGKIQKVLLAGVHIKNNDQRQLFVNEGYTPIDDETYNVLLGNRDMGDNGTGYVWDDKTGKPVSAPPAPPVEAEPQEPPVDPERLAVYEAMAAQEERLAAYAERIAALEAKGGEGK